MIEYIEKHIGRLRQKPEHVRKHIAFFTSFGITAIIFIFWIVSFGINSQVVADNNVEVKPPLSSLTASIGDVFVYIKEMIVGANKATYSSDNIEVSPGKI